MRFPLVLSRPLLQRKGWVVREKGREMLLSHKEVKKRYHQCLRVQLARYRDMPDVFLAIQEALL